MNISKETTDKIEKLPNTKKGLRDAAKLLERVVTGKRYFVYPRKAASIPAGHVVVHNHVYPLGTAKTVGILGTDINGSRCWHQPPTADIEVCPCKWAPEYGTHYRVIATHLHLPRTTPAA